MQGLVRSLLGCPVGGPNDEHRTGSKAEWLLAPRGSCGATTGEAERTTDRIIHHFSRVTLSHETR